MCGWVTHFRLFWFLRRSADKFRSQQSKNVEKTHQKYIIGEQSLIKIVRPTLSTVWARKTESDICHTNRPRMFEWTFQWKLLIVHGTNLYWCSLRWRLCAVVWGAWVVLGRFPDFSLQPAALLPHWARVGSQWGIRHLTLRCWSVSLLPKTERKNQHKKFEQL